MKLDFWRDRRVLVTGHTGFKGSWLCMWLQALGAKVCGLALPPPTVPSLFVSARVDEGMRSCIGNICEPNFVKQVVDGFDPEVIFHLAAQPLVRYSYENPVDTFATNVMGLVNLLEAVRQSRSVQVVVNVTSDKCYENCGSVWHYKEDDPLGGYDPYSSSKGCAELVSSAYRRSFLASSNVGLATARAGNVIGGGDWAKDRLIPDILRALDEGVSVSIRHPEAVRPWQHVLEPLAGYLSLAGLLWCERVRLAQAWNFGPQLDDVKPVSWVADYMCQKWGGGARWGAADGSSDGRHEANLLSLDASKARAQLGWTPRWSLSQALDKTMEWHKSWRMNQDTRALVFRHIEGYMEASAS